nr:MAG TPA: hypothetical protein [Caudoviricetes sp.]
MFFSILLSMLDDMPLIKAITPINPAAYVKCS